MMLLLLIWCIAKIYCEDFKFKLYWSNDKLINKDNLLNESYAYFQNDVLKIENQIELNIKNINPNYLDENNLPYYSQEFYKINNKTQHNYMNFLKEIKFDPITQHFSCISFVLKQYEPQNLNYICANELVQNISEKIRDIYSQNNLKRPAENLEDQQMLILSQIDLDTPIYMLRNIEQLQIKGLLDIRTINDCQVSFAYINYTNYLQQDFNPNCCLQFKSEKNDFKLQKINSLKKFLQNQCKLEIQKSQHIVQPNVKIDLNHPQYQYFIDKNQLGQWQGWTNIYAVKTQATPSYFHPTFIKLEDRKIMIFEDPLQKIFKNIIDLEHIIFPCQKQENQYHFCKIEECEFMKNKYEKMKFQEWSNFVQNKTIQENCFQILLDFQEFIICPIIKDANLEKAVINSFRLSEFLVETKKKIETQTVSLKRGCVTADCCEGVYGGIPIALKKLENCDLNLYNWFIFLSNEKNIYFSPYSQILSGKLPDDGTQKYNVLQIYNSCWELQSDFCDIKQYLDSLNQRLQSQKILRIKNKISLMFQAIKQDIENNFCFVLEFQNNVAHYLDTFLICQYSKEENDIMKQRLKKLYESALLSLHLKDPDFCYLSIPELDSYFQVRIIKQKQSQQTLMKLGINNAYQLLTKEKILFQYSQISYDGNNCLINQYVDKVENKECCFSIQIEKKLQIYCVVTQTNCQIQKNYLYFKLNQLCLQAYDTYNFNGENIKETNKNETLMLKNQQFQMGIRENITLHKIDQIVRFQNGSRIDFTQIDPLIKQNYQNYNFTLSSKASDNFEFEFTHKYFLPSKNYNLFEFINRFFHNKNNLQMYVQCLRLTDRKLDKNLTLNFLIISNQALQFYDYQNGQLIKSINLAQIVQNTFIEKEKSHIDYITKHFQKFKSRKEQMLLKKIIDNQKQNILAEDQQQFCLIFDFQITNTKAIENDYLCFFNEEQKQAFLHHLQYFFKSNYDLTQPLIQIKDNQILELALFENNQLKQEGFRDLNCYFKNDKLYQNHDLILELTDIMPDTSEISTKYCQLKTVQKFPIFSSIEKTCCFMYLKKSTKSVFLYKQGNLYLQQKPILLQKFQDVCLQYTIDDNVQNKDSNQALILNSDIKNGIFEGLVKSSKIQFDFQNLLNPVFQNSQINFELKGFSLKFDAGIQEIEEKSSYIEINNLCQTKNKICSASDFLQHMKTQMNSINYKLLQDRVSHQLKKLNRKEHQCLIIIVKKQMFYNNALFYDQFYLVICEILEFQIIDIKKVLLYHINKIV